MGVEVNEPHRELQKFMLKKYNEGMLLTLCSKSNQADVREVFEKNPGMILRKNHFVHWKINGRSMADNLKEMARGMNLGLDSFIFLDSSPMVCSQVETRCPGVLTLQLPENPLEIPLFLKYAWVFDRFKTAQKPGKSSPMDAAERKGWDIKPVNEKKLLHKHHFLPLKYSVGSLLLDLPPRAAGVKSE